MNFNSPGFALFMLVVGGAYLALHGLQRTHRAQNLMLLGASYAFYGSWDHRFLFLIVVSTGVDYVCGLGLAGQRPKRGAVISLVSMLAAASVGLCAPIDWGGLAAGLLPASAYQGGWVEAPAGGGLLLAAADWTPFWGAIGAAVVVLGVLGAGTRLRGNTRRRYFLVTSVVANLTLLGFFKYYDFFVDSAAELAGLVGLGGFDWTLGIVVPVGISFYTFQTMSYTIDIYRGELEPTDDLVDFALFVAFFPQLVAGPIERARVLLPQLQRRRPLRWDQIQVGAWLIGWGLFKKIFIADNLARLVTPAYTVDAAVIGPEVLLATYAFALQIYCDFSGYSDIARGVSRLMGVELMVNFNVPYAATNPQEFWRRWHISLSTWLRDYLYIGLGGNRGGSYFVYRNLTLTMVLGGMWHGARANFVWWGLYQGALLAVHRAIQPMLEAKAPKGPVGARLWRAACWVFFFHLVCYGWLLFRAESNAQIAALTAALGTGWGQLGAHLGVLARIGWFSGLLIVIQVLQVRSRNLLHPLTWPWPLRLCLYGTLFYLTVIFGAFDAVEFIYFQF